MAFKFVQSGATGDYQTIFNRIIEDPETISLTNDTAGPLSSQSIPFDGIDDSISFDNIIITEGIGVSGASAVNVSFDGFIKHNSTTTVERATFFDASVMRNLSATTSAFDGFYIGSVILTGGNHYIEFRMNHDEVFSYVLTSEATITTTAWHNVFCEYASGAQTMNIWIDGALDSSSTLAEVITGSPLGERGISWGGRLDELRLWLATGSASAIGQLASATAIGSAPEELPANEFSPSAEYLASWWRFDTVSAIQLFSAIADSITDSSANGDHTGTPSGFQGSDIVSSEQTIIQGLSASGDLVDLLGGSLDHGGLTILDTSNNTLKYEPGQQNMMKDDLNVWTVSGAGVSQVIDNNNIFYGASGIRVNTTNKDTGVYQDISNSALLYTGNTYTMSLRYRSISGANHARITLYLGDTVSSVTGVTNLNTWKPIYLSAIHTGSTLSGRVEVLGIDDGQSSALFQIDGISVTEGGVPFSFVAPDRIRKAGQLYWPIED